MSPLFFILASCIRLINGQSFWNQLEGNIEKNQGWQENQGVATTTPAYDPNTSTPGSTMGLEAVTKPSERRIKDMHGGRREILIESPGKNREGTGANVKSQVVSGTMDVVKLAKESEISSNLHETQKDNSSRVIVVEPEVVPLQYNPLGDTPGGKPVILGAPVAHESKLIEIDPNSPFNITVSVVNQVATSSKHSNQTSRGKNTVDSNIDPNSVPHTYNLIMEPVPQFLGMSNEGVSQNTHNEMHIIGLDTTFGNKEIQQSRLEPDQPKSSSNSVDNKSTKGVIIGDGTKNNIKKSEDKSRRQKFKNKEHEENINLAGIQTTGSRSGEKKDRLTADKPKTSNISPDQTKQKSKSTVEEVVIQSTSQPVIEDISSNQSPGGVIISAMNIVSGQLTDTQISDGDKTTSMETIKTKVWDKNETVPKTSQKETDTNNNTAIQNNNKKEKMTENVVGSVMKSHDTPIEQMDTRKPLSFDGAAASKGQPQLSGDNGSRTIEEMNTSNVSAFESVARIATERGLGMPEEQSIKNSSLLDGAQQMTSDTRLGNSNEKQIDTVLITGGSTQMAAESGNDTDIAKNTSTIKSDSQMLSESSPGTATEKRFIDTAEDSGGGIQISFDSSSGTAREESIRRMIASASSTKMPVESIPGTKEEKPIDVLSTERSTSIGTDTSGKKPMPNTTSAGDAALTTFGTEEKKHSEQTGATKIATQMAVDSGSGTKGGKSFDSMITFEGKKQQSDSGGWNADSVIPINERAETKTTDNLSTIKGKQFVESLKTVPSENSTDKEFNRGKDINSEATLKIYTKTSDSDVLTVQEKAVGNAIVSDGETHQIANISNDNSRDKLVHTVIVTDDTDQMVADSSNGTRKKLVDAALVSDVSNQMAANSGNGTTIEKLIDTALTSVVTTRMTDNKDNGTTRELIDTDLVSNGATPIISESVNVTSRDKIIYTGLASEGTTEITSDSGNVTIGEDTSMVSEVTSHITADSGIVTLKEKPVYTAMPSESTTLMTANHGFSKAGVDLIDSASSDVPATHKIDLDKGSGRPSADTASYVLPAKPEANFGSKVGKTLDKVEKQGNDTSPNMTKPKDRVTQAEIGFIDIGGIPIDNIIAFEGTSKTKPDGGLGNIKESALDGVLTLEHLTASKHDEGLKAYSESSKGNTTALKNVSPVTDTDKSENTANKDISAFEAISDSSYVGETSKIRLPNASITFGKDKDVHTKTKSIAGITGDGQAGLAPTEKKARSDGKSMLETTKSYDGMSSTGGTATKDSVKAKNLNTQTESVLVSHSVVKNDSEIGDGSIDRQTILNTEKMQDHKPKIVIDGAAEQKTPTEVDSIVGTEKSVTAKSVGGSDKELIGIPIDNAAFAAYASKHDSSLQQKLSKGTLQESYIGNISSDGLAVPTVLLDDIPKVKDTPIATVASEGPIEKSDVGGILIDNKVGTFGTKREGDAVGKLPPESRMVSEDIPKGMIPREKVTLSKSPTTIEDTLPIKIYNIGNKTELSIDPVSDISIQTQTEGTIVRGVSSDSKVLNAVESKNSKARGIIETRQDGVVVDVGKKPNIGTRTTEKSQKIDNSIQPYGSTVKVLEKAISSIDASKSAGKSEHQIDLTKIEHLPKYRTEVYLGKTNETIDGVLGIIDETQIYSAVEGLQNRNFKMPATIQNNGIDIQSNAASLSEDPLNTLGRFGTLEITSMQGQQLGSTDKSRTRENVLGDAYRTVTFASENQEHIPKKRKDSKTTRKVISDGSTNTTTSSSQNFDSFSRRGKLAESSKKASMGVKERRGMPTVEIKSAIKDADGLAEATVYTSNTKENEVGRVVSYDPHPIQGQTIQKKSVEKGKAKMKKERIAHKQTVKGKEKGVDKWKGKGRDKIKVNGRDHGKDKGPGPGFSRGKGPNIGEGKERGIVEGKIRRIGEGKGRRIAEVKGRGIDEGKGRRIGAGKGRRIGEGKGRRIAEVKGREIDEGKGRRITEVKGREIDGGKGPGIVESKGRRIGGVKGSGIDESKDPGIGKGIGKSQLSTKAKKINMTESESRASSHPIIPASAISVDKLATHMKESHSGANIKLSVPQEKGASTDIITKLPAESKTRSRQNYMIKEDSKQAGNFKAEEINFSTSDAARGRGGDMFGNKNEYNRQNELTEENLESLCAYSAYIDGIGYANYPGDCQKLVQCYRYRGRDIAILRDCPFGYFWDQELVLCRPPIEVPCYDDPCLDIDLMHYNRSGCRSFHTCDYGVSVPTCCEVGFRYNGDSCVPDPHCTDTCQTPFDIETKLRYQSCKFIRDEYNPYGYLTMEHNGLRIRACPAGTVFSARQCGCRMYGRARGKHHRRRGIERCTPQFKMDFNDGFRESSGSMMAFEASNVVINDGAAQFDGKGKITLWGFMNKELGKQFAIKLRFKADPTSTNSGSLIANCGMSGTRSVGIGFENHQLKSEVKSMSFSRPTVIKDHFDPYDWNDVIFVYDGGSFIVKTNGFVHKKSVGGLLQTRANAMVIGGCPKPGTGFKGLIDHIEVFSGCIPRYNFKPSGTEHKPGRKLGHSHGLGLGRRRGHRPVFGLVHQL